MYIIQLTCLIHVPVNSPYEYKVLGDFGTKYAKGRHIKDHIQEPSTKKKFGIQQDKNAVV